MIETILDYVNERLLGNEQTHLTESDELLESGLLDSMGIMSLINFIENRFQVKIPPHEMTIENFQSVKNISDYLEQRAV